MEDGRDPETGRFANGWKGGPGNPGKRRNRMREVVTPEVEECLWKAELAASGVEDAAQASDARRFLLRNVAGNPYQAAPDVPPLEWPKIRSVADLAGMVHTILEAQEAGLLDGAAFGFMIDLVGKLSKAFESVELGPEVKRLKEHVAALVAGGQLLRQ